MPKSFLSRNEKHDLAKFIAGTGQNYDRYSQYAERRGWIKFTPYYFKRWVHNHNALIRKYREIHMEEVQRISIYDRVKRIEALERSIELIDSHLTLQASDYGPHECTGCGFAHEVIGPEIAIKLMEQKRKLLEQIAKERNEWMKPSDEVQQDDARTALRAAVMEAITAPRKKTIVNGEVILGGD